MFTARSPFLLLPLCAAALLAEKTFSAPPTPLHPAPRHMASAGGWKTYKNAALGFALAEPAGWTVQADPHSILVQDPKRREVVLMETFTPEPDESAQAHLMRLAQERAAMFPEAQMVSVDPQPSAGDEVSGVFSYADPQGPGQGRVLCSVMPDGKGLVFVLAAPASGFPAAQPALLRIVKSLRFMAPAGSAAKTATAGGAAAQEAAALRGMQFVTWSDPREHGFHVEIPKGWKADGGAFRFGPTDVRIAYQVLSPDKGMAVVVGDPRLPSSFNAPIALTEQIGMRDGTNGLLHFMSAPEFNRWYLGQISGQQMDDFKIGEEYPMDQRSRRRTAQAQQFAPPGVQVEASVGMTEFSGRSKLIGKPVIGVILSTTQRMSGRAGVGGGVDCTTWFASPILLVCTDDAVKARSQQTMLAVLTRLRQTYREYPEWDKKRIEEMNQSTEQVGRRTSELSRQMIQNSQGRTRQISNASDAAREASMGAYWNHENAQDEQQHGFINYLGDRTDVGGDGGPTVNVQSGSKHYYRNAQTGTILGTDSESSPGVDFTPLSER